MIKDWIVGRLAGALADYLEGVTSDTVNASLGSDIGILDLTARLNPNALKAFNLDLQDSEVSVKVRVPWRQLTTRPVEISICHLFLNVKMRPRGTAAASEVDVLAARVAKAREVQRLEAQPATKREFKKVRRVSIGKVAQLSHAILRQLRVTVGRLDACVQRDVVGLEPLYLSSNGARLESVGPDWVSTPREGQQDLYKLLSFSGILVRIGALEPVLAPLAVSVRLWHAPIRKHVELSIEVPEIETATSVLLTPYVVSYLRGCLAWSLQVEPKQQLPIDAAQIYSILFTKRLCGEQFDADALQSIEDVAEASLIVAWREKCRERVASNPSCAAFRAPSKRTGFFFGWKARPDESISPLASPGGSTSDDDIFAAVADEQAGKFTDVDWPNSMNVAVKMPRFEARYNGTKNCLQFVACGAEAYLELKGQSLGDLVDVPFLWEVSADMQMRSSTLSVDIDGRKAGGDWIFKFFEDDSTEAGSGDTDGKPIALSVVAKASRRNVISGLKGKPLPWDFVLTLRGQPIQMQLSPWTFHSVLTALVEAYSCREATCGEWNETRPTSGPAVLDDSPHTTQGDADSGSGISSVVANLMDADATTFLLDVIFEAPVLWMKVPHGTGTLVTHLGNFCARTCVASSVARTCVTQDLPIPSSVTWAACTGLFELKNTRIAVVEDTVEHWVYKPATVLLCLVKQGEGDISIRAETSAMTLFLNPQFLLMLGQLHVGAGYAMAPLASVVASLPDRTLVDSSTPGDTPVGKLATKSRIPLHVNISFPLCELAWGSREDARVVVARLQGVQANAVQAEGLVLEASQTNLDVAYRDFKVFESNGLLTTNFVSTSQTAQIKIVAPPAEVRWSPAAMREALCCGHTAVERFRAGQAIARQLFVAAGDDEVVLLQQWNRFVNQRTAEKLEKLQGEFWSEAQRLGIGDTLHVQDLQAQDRGDSAVEQVAKSLDLQVSFAELQLTFHPRKTTQERMWVVARQTEVQVCRAPDGPLTAQLCLASVEITLGSRQILAPRRLDVPLLRAEFVAHLRGEAPSLQLNWAQVVVVFRQREFDAITERLVEDVSSILLPPSTDEPTNISMSIEQIETVPETHVDRGAQPMSVGVRYTLQVEAPLLFLPTDASGGVVGSLDGGLFTEDCGGRTFKPVPGEGYVVIDFGHLDVSGNAKRGEVAQILLREMQVFSSERDPAAQNQRGNLEDASSNSKGAFCGSPSRRGGLEATLSRIINPVGLDIRYCSTAEKLDIVVVPLEQTRGGVEHLTLTRAQTTQLIDVIFLNINYRVADARRSPASPRLIQRSFSSSTASRSRALLDASVASREIRFLFKWPGDFNFDVGFTADSPLARLELIDVELLFVGTAQSYVTDIKCGGAAIKDTRTRARNTQKCLLEVRQPVNPNTVGLGLLFDLPCGSRAGEPMQVQIRGCDPIAWLLPQLFTDLSTWGSSAYKHTAQAKMQLLACPDCAEEVAQAVQVLDIHFSGAAIRVMASWDEPSELFELVGHVHSSVIVNVDDIRIEKLVVTEGVLRRGSMGGSSGILCPKLEAEMCSSFQRTIHNDSGARLGVFRIEVLTIRHFWIRLSLLDLSVLMKALASIAEMEADSAEPGVEIRLRDPDFYGARFRFLMTASVEVEGVQLMLVDTSSRPVLEMIVNCPLVLLRNETIRGAPPSKASLGTDHISLGVRFYNERIGKWEPVLTKSSWFVKCFAAPKVGSKEGIADLKLSPADPIHVVITVPFVHRMLQLFEDQIAPDPKRKRCHYGELLLGLNLTGIGCTISRFDATVDDLELQKTYLPPSGTPMKLDDLIMNVAERASALPDIWLTGLDGCPDLRHKIRLVSEESHVVSTPLGDILISIAMPRPPQRVLLISSNILLTNRTTLDIEVRSLTGSLTDFLEGLVVPSEQRFAAVSLLESLEDWEDSKVFNGSSPGRLWVPPGYVLAAPLDMRLNALALQVRPALSSTGIEYNWGDELNFDTLQRGVMSVCECTDAEQNLPKYNLRLRIESERRLQRTSDTKWCNIDIEAPFRLANACPCEIYCAMSALTNTNHLGDLSDVCDPVETLEVHDGTGVFWKVLPNTKVDILPLSLDGDGYITWTVGTSRGRTRLKPASNYVRVHRRGGEVTWMCFKLQCTKAWGTPLRLSAQHELPIFDLPSEQFVICVALKERCSGKFTGWSEPILVAKQARQNATKDVPLRLSWDSSGGGAFDIRLVARREQDGFIVIYARNWFADSTGLEVALTTGVGNHFPLFGSCELALLGDLDHNDAGINLKLNSHPLVHVLVPQVGGSVKCSLSPLHDCVLRVEPVAMSSTFGTFSRLLTLVPSIMMFSCVKGFEVGFLQEGTSSGPWLTPGEGSSFYWKRPDKPKRIVVGVRPLSSTNSTHATTTEYSAAFEISERGMGAFPISLMESESRRRLVCVQIETCGELVTVTAGGHEHCHQIVNRHPCLVLDCFFEIEKEIDVHSHFVAQYGEQRPIARGCRNPKTKSQLIITLGDIINSASFTEMRVDLERSGVYKVPQSYQFSIPTEIYVELRARASMVTVAPQVIGGLSKEVLWSGQLSLKVPRLSLSLVGEQPRAEVIACTFSGLSLLCQHDDLNSRQETSFEVTHVQADLLHPRQEVVLASEVGGARALLVSVVREDLYARNVVIRKVDASLGKWEVTVFEDLINEVKRLGKILTPSQLGLDFDAAISRAGVPFHLCCGHLAAKSAKYIVRDVTVGEFRLNVWCSLRVNLFPDILSIIMTLSSFSDTLQVEGATVKLPEQLLFSGARNSSTFEGSLEGLCRKVWESYKPHIVSSWHSVLRNSNAVLGGLFSRQLWNPKQRESSTTMRPPLPISDGAGSSSSSTSKDGLVSVPGTADGPPILFEWHPLKRGKPIPARAVLAGSTRTDGSVYVGRFKGEAGKINVDHGKMHSFWGHSFAEQHTADILVCAEEADCSFVPIKRGDPIPPSAVEAGTTRRDGVVFVGRHRGEPGKINTVSSKNRAMHNFWGHHEGCHQSAEILVFTARSKTSRLRHS